MGRLRPPTRTQIRNNLRGTKLAKTYVHVNQHVRKRNKKLGLHDPVISIRTGKKVYRVRRAWINGPSVIQYTPDKPLSCGADTYLICDSQYVCLEIDGQERRLEMIGSEKKVVCENGPTQ